MEKITTIIADGNEIFRHGLRSILSEHHFDVVSETDNGALVLSAFENVVFPLPRCTWLMPLLPTAMSKFPSLFRSPTDSAYVF